MQHGILPGRYRLDRALGACGADPGVPRVAAGPVLTSSFASRFRRREVEMVIMRPPGADGPLPVALVLHGAGGNARTAISLGYPQYLAVAASGSSATRFAAVSVDGGGSSYWHRRDDRDDPQAMLIQEVLPRLGRQGYLTSKIGLIGWSMGGYGALLLASSLPPTRVAAVAASSPAIFPSYAAAISANRGSFDSPADFAANDISSPPRLAALKRIPCRIDCGSSDPFAAQSAAFRRGLGNPVGAVSAGCHDQAFWRRALPAELGFLGEHITPAFV
ncbi:MAG: hypothetical protein J2P27_14545 [Actinobacteria bacterium]|nr:hypothetical protein [Actinomycetota bacterium]